MCIHVGFYRFTEIGPVKITYGAFLGLFRVKDRRNGRFIHFIGTYSVFILLSIAE